MPLRIAMLSLHSSPIGRLGTATTGGMSIYVQGLARRLGVLGHAVDIFTCWKDEEAAPLVDLAPHVRLLHVTGWGGGGTPSKDRLFNAAEAVAEAIARLSVDLGATYDLIHSNYWLSGIVGERLKMRWRCPHLITFHTLGAAKVHASGGQEEHSCRLAEESGLMRHCDGVIVPTRAERDRYLEIFPEGPSRMHIVPCGVDLEQFKPVAPAGQRRAGRRPRKRLLFVGRFDAMKGIDTLLEGLACLEGEPPVELLLIGGDGPESPAYLRIAAKALEQGLGDRVCFQGPVEHRLMVHQYNAADAVVVSSCYESFGLVIVEGLACGVPVAAMPVGIAPEIIRPGGNGYLSEGPDAKSLAVAIQKTLILAEKRDPMKIRDSVAEFSWARVACLLLDVYHKAVEEQLVDTERREGYHGR